MGNFKRFRQNLWLSLLAYFSVSFSGTLCLMLLNYTTRGPFGFGIAPPRTPLWVEIILWSHVLGSAVLYFYFGTRLKSIGNHLLNFLSVSGSMAFGFLLICLEIYFDLYLIFLGMFSFFRFMVFMADTIDNDNVALSIVSILPAVIIWLGMLYKTKKI